MATLSSWLGAAGYRRLWHRALWLLLLLGGSTTARATHIVGGELSLQHQQGSTYALSLMLYFDALNGNPRALDSSLTASIFEQGTNRRMRDIRLPLVSSMPVAYANPACTQSSISTKRLVYTQNLDLPADTYTNVTGYYVAVERCCRNATITNLVAPDAAAQTFYLEFPAVTRGGQPFLDSSPTLFAPLSDYACIGTPFAADFGGQDADGDSLAYDLVTPLNGHATTAAAKPTPAPGPYVPVTWGAGFSTNYQIAGAPTLQVHPRTGHLTVLPTTAGLYAFGVRCTSYRHGQKIGECRRDYQLYVLNCPHNAPPVGQVLPPTSGAGVYVPGRDTLRFEPGVDRCIRVRYTDPDPNTHLILTAVPVNFTSDLPTFTTPTAGTVAGPTDTLTATLCFPACLDTDGQIRLLDLVIADDGCSQPRRDTVRLAFTAHVPNVPPVLTSTFPAPTNPAADTLRVVRVPLGTTYVATLTGSDADGNPLTLNAAGQGFDLAAAQMTFDAQNGPGRASSTFRWQPTCEAVALHRDLIVRFELQEAACRPKPQQLLVRFEVESGDTATFLPPNIITPNQDGLNDVFSLPDLPPDFCDVRFASISIYTRWGTPVFHSPERLFRWGGNGETALYYYLVTFTNGRHFKGWLEVVPGGKVPIRGGAN